MCLNVKEKLSFGGSWGIHGLMTCCIFFKICSKLLFKTDMLFYRLEPIVKIILHVQQEHTAWTLASVLAISALSAVPDIDLNMNLDVQVGTFMASSPHTD